MLQGCVEGPVRVYDSSSSCQGCLGSGFSGLGFRNGAYCWLSFLVFRAPCSILRGTRRSLDESPNKPKRKLRYPKGDSMGSPLKSLYPNPHKPLKPRSTHACPFAKLSKSLALHIQEPGGMILPMIHSSNTILGPWVYIMNKP